MGYHWRRPERNPGGHLIRFELKNITVGDPSQTNQFKSQRRFFHRSFFVVFSSVPNFSLFDQNLGNLGMFLSGTLAFARTMKVKDAPEKTGNIMVRPEVRSLLHEQCLGIWMMRTFSRGLMV